ncbi:MAG: ABC transporter permease [Rhodobacterales bacterium]
MNIQIASLLKKDWFGLLIVVLLSGVCIAILRPAFLSPFNLYVLMVSTSYMLVIALAQMIIIAIGQMNLSVGAIGGLVAISFSGIMEVYQLPVPIAIFIGLFIGIGCGFLNGYITVKSGISAFIITLATLYIFKGINLGITEAEPFYKIPESVKIFGNAKIGSTPIPHQKLLLLLILFLAY